MPKYRTALLICLSVLLITGCGDKNHFPDIPYTDHARLISQSPEIGTSSLIDSLASSVKDGTSEDILAGIWFLIQDHLQYHLFNPDSAHYRNFDALIREGTYTGSADHSILFGTLCRARGIPVVWVKAADYAWIAEYAKYGDKTEYYSGYTYLECYLDNAWKLVDCYSGIIYDDHDTGNPNLPGNRYAFAKGTDPHALHLDTEWDTWKKEVAAFFAGFDTDELVPVERVDRDFLLKRFKGKRPSIGVKIQNTDDKNGVTVIHVKRGFPADKAGVMPGDVITHVDATHISDIFQLVEIIKRKGFDSAFSLGINRDGSPLSLPVVIPAP